MNFHTTNQFPPLRFDSHDGWSPGLLPGQCKIREAIELSKISNIHNYSHALPKIPK